MPWAFLMVAIVLSVGGQALLKAGAGAASFVAQLLDWHTVAGLAMYGGSAVAYIVALRRIPLSVALPCTALSYIVVALIGHYLFGEALGAQKLLGLGLIGAGVVLLAAA